ncbi:MAG: Response regulator of zinc sigma-54-dependent two-component system [Labilithrix sp.]|nr:Response regulator of zinc sigma-54-dependent two-component system [Labilithrix sp.]
MSVDDPTRPELSSHGLSPAVRVLVLWDGGSSTHFLSPGASITLGRHSDCEIVIDLPSVSRRHARITGGEPARIEDLGGMNGIRVRGVRIPTGQPVALDGGDVVELGGAVVVLQGPRSSASPAPGVSRATQAPGESPMKAVDRLVELVARSEIGVLLLGETGVGKTVTAQAIHDRSKRARGPLVRLNCAAFPEALLEGELFGYERGAFTGATQAKVGLLESAAGGTVLLDEIGEMPLATQVKLLTVIETREVLRLGSLRPRAIDVRFLAATNRDLLARAGEGSFRADLYYRLNGISIVIPPLRERATEIPVFAHRFLEEACARAGRPPLGIASEAMGALFRHPFHGNLRELRNTIERASVLAQGSSVLPEHLLFDPPSPSFAIQTAPAPGPAPVSPPVSPPVAQPASVPAPASPSPGPLRDQLVAFERERIIRALSDCNGNQTRAAELLGMSRRALIQRIEDYKLPRPRKR